MSSSLKKIIELTVTNGSDSGPGSLREAISKANSNPNSNSLTRINIKSFKGPITLTSGEISIESDIEILNDSGSNLIIRAAPASRIFHVSAPTTILKINSLCHKITLTGGSSLNGGAIYVDSPSILILRNVIFFNNSAADSGGAIYTQGPLTLIHSEIKSNSAGSQGAGIWAALNVNLISSQISKNTISIIDPSSGGAGIFIDDGNLLMEKSLIKENFIAYDLEANLGGSGAGVVIESGSIYVQSESHIDENSSYNSGGIQINNGNVFLTSNSTINRNQSFNSSIGAAGGGGITISIGAVFIEDSFISDNITIGMYSGGIVSLVGDVSIHNSKISGNTNRGPGGGIAMNVGNVTVNSSKVCNNRGASVGGGIVNFSPKGTITVYKSSIEENILTNAESIQQTIESFLDVILGNLSDISLQAKKSGGTGSQKFLDLIPSVIAQLEPISASLKGLDFGLTAATGGGGIASFLTATIIIDHSSIENNFAGLKVSDTNSPFISMGGGIFAFESPVVIRNSSIKKNLTLDFGGGIWSKTSLNISDSKVNSNILRREDSNGGGIHNSGEAVILNTKIESNIAKGRGGGVYNENKLTLFSSSISRNKSKNGGGIYSTLPFFKHNTCVCHNTPNNIEINN